MTLDDSDHTPVRVDPVADATLAALQKVTLDDSEPAQLFREDMYNAIETRQAVYTPPDCDLTKKQPPPFYDPSFKTEHKLFPHQLRTFYPPNSEVADEDKVLLRNQFAEDVREYATNNPKLAPTETEFAKHYAITKNDLHHTDLSFKEPKTGIFTSETPLLVDPRFTSDTLSLRCRTFRSQEQKDKAAADYKKQFPDATLHQIKLLLATSPERYSTQRHKPLNYNLDESRSWPPPAGRTLSR